MKALLSSACIGSVVVALVLTTTGAAAQDNDIATARDLYASAAYEDALAMLNRLRSTDRPASQSRVIEQYRAFCFLALGRPNDAEQAIEAVVVADPLYHPAENEVSPSASRSSARRRPPRHPRRRHRRPRRSSRRRRLRRRRQPPRRRASTRP